MVGDWPDIMASDAGPDRGKSDKKEHPAAPNAASAAKEINPIRAPDISFPWGNRRFTANLKWRARLGKPSNFLKMECAIPGGVTNLTRVPGSTNPSRIQ